MTYMIVELFDLEDMTIYPRCKVKLPPKSKDGMVTLYLLGKSFEESLSISSSNILHDSRHSFKYFYRPCRYIFKLFNFPIRRMELSTFKSIQEIVSKYEEHPYMKYPKVKFTQLVYNTMYDLSRYNELFATKVANKPIKKCIDAYFTMLRDAIPTANAIVLINGHTKMDISNISSIKTSPVLLLYYALMKSEKSLSILGDIRFLIQSPKATFICTPSKLSRHDLSTFKMYLKKTLGGTIDKAIDNDQVDTMVDVDEAENDAVNIQDSENQEDKNKLLNSNEFDLIGNGLAHISLKNTQSKDKSNEIQDIEQEEDKQPRKPQSKIINEVKPQFQPLPNFKNPQDLLVFCNDIPYGLWDSTYNKLVDIGGSKYKESLKRYRIQTIEEFATKHGGWCIDFVPFEYYMLSKMNYKPRAFYIGDKQMHKVHAFIIYQVGNDYVYFESVDGNMRGLHMYKTLEEAIKDASIQWAKFNLKSGTIYVHEFNPMRTIGMSVIRFSSEIRKSRVFMTIDMNEQKIPLPKINEFKKIVRSVALDDEDIDDIDDTEEPENDIDEEQDDNAQDDDTQDDILSEDESSDESDDTIVNAILDKTTSHNTGGKSTSRTSSKRDAILREEQKRKIVNGKTIQEIVSSKGSSVPIPVLDLSSSVKSPNQGSATMTSINFDKIYEEQVKDKDIVSIFDNLENTQCDFHILSIDKKDTSDVQTLKETWTVKMETNDRKRHTVVVDIPKLFDNIYYLIDGVKYILQKQVLFLPIVKIDKDNVRITTNYNRMIISRTNKKLAEVAQCISMLRKSSSMSSHIQLGHITNPKSFLTTMEYDQYANEIAEIRYNGVTLIFNQSILKEFAKSQGISIDPKLVPIGYTKKDKIEILYVDPMSGKDSNGNTITQIISNLLPPNLKSKSKFTTNIYSTAKLNGKNMPIIIILLIWEGLTKTLKMIPSRIKFMILGISDKVPNGMMSIKWKDFILAYDTSVESQLLFNGLSQLNTSEISLEDADSITSYTKYIGELFKMMRAIYMLQTAHELWVDPISKEILKDLDLPTDISNILIYANALLSDNSYTDENDMAIYRIRCGETIPGILHYVLASNYSIYNQHNRSVPFSIPRNSVIRMLLELTTMSSHSTLNPAMDSISRNTISPRGYQGTNKDRAYNEKKRSYNDTMIGTMSLSTSTDGNAGIRREITANTNIINARGYSDLSKRDKELTNTNLFALSELLTVNTVRFDDPYRTSMTVKQTGHMIYTKKSDPCLVSNGADELIAYMASSAFAVKAEEDGEVVEVNEDAGFAIVKYKSGRNRAIDLKSSVEHNSGGGFYIDNSLVLNDIKKGDKVKANQILAYNPKYFSASKLSGVRFKIGKLCKVAIMSSYNTYQDAGVYTQKLANDLATNVVFKESVILKPWANVSSIVEEGEHVSVGDPLIAYQEEKSGDGDISSILAELGEELGTLVNSLAITKKQSSKPGSILRIELFCTVPLEKLSPSLRKIVEAYYKKSGKRKEILNKYDSSDGIVKCGVLITDSDNTTKPNQYGKIGSTTVDEGVLINFFIQHETALSIGDKVCLFTANKTIVSEIIESGYEPFSEYRPDEEISALVGESAILNRMTPSILLTCAENKLMIELKRKIEEIWKS